MHGQLALQRKLTEALTAAKLKNRAFSLRAFARKLELSPAALSEIINGKRRVSKKLAERIVRNLVLPPNESKMILELFPEPGAPRRIPMPGIPAPFVDLSTDQFHVISEWYHFAILSLAETKDFRNDSKWISSRLNIKVSEAQTALERLERLGMLKMDANGQLRASGSQYATPDDIANLALRKSHVQNLDLANRSLEKDDVHERDFTAITMAIDMKRLPVAKKMMREFRDQLCAYLEAGEKREVFKLCLQLFPLTDLRGGESYEH